MSFKSSKGNAKNIHKFHDDYFISKLTSVKHFSVIWRLQRYNSLKRSRLQLILISIKKSVIAHYARTQGNVIILIKGFNSMRAMLTIIRS